MSRSSPLLCPDVEVHETVEFQVGKKCGSCVVEDNGAVGPGEGEVVKGRRRVADHVEAAARNVSAGLGFRTSPGKV
jgi:hypothetical protein